jgi:hypothetical protein
LQSPAFGKLCNKPEYMQLPIGVQRLNLLRLLQPELANVFRSQMRFARK